MAEKISHKHITMLVDMNKYKYNVKFGKHAQCTQSTSETTMLLNVVKDDKYEPSRSSITDIMMKKYRLVILLLSEDVR